MNRFMVGCVVVGALSVPGLLEAQQGDGGQHESAQALQTRVSSISVSPTSRQTQRRAGVSSTVRRGYRRPGRTMSTFARVSQQRVGM